MVKPKDAATSGKAGGRAASSAPELVPFSYELASDASPLTDAEMEVARDFRPTEMSSLAMAYKVSRVRPGARARHPIRARATRIVLRPGTHGPTCAHPLRAPFLLGLPALPHPRRKRHWPCRLCARRRPLRAQYADEMKYYINIANSCSRLTKAAMDELISAGGTAKGTTTTRARTLFYVRVGERAQSLAHVRASGWGRSDPGAMPLCAASLRACQASAQARRSAAELQFARARCDR